MSLECDQESRYSLGTRDERAEMAKLDLAVAKEEYHLLVERASTAERAGDAPGAIRFARNAWQHVVDMMKYEQKYETGTFRSLPCIDIVCRLAPPLLDGEALEELGGLLKTNRSIDRVASDDLADRLRQARDELAAFHRLYALIESRSGVTATEVQALLGGDLGWDARLGQARQLRTVRVGSHDKANAVEATGNSEALVTGWCVRCGLECILPLCDFLTLSRCTSCGRAADTCIRSIGAVSRPTSG